MAERALIEATEASLAAVPADDPRTAALHELARRYARLIDGAADLAEDFANADPPDNGNERQAFDALKRRAGEVEAAKDLGPKLLATLQALGIGNAPSSAHGAAPAKVDPASSKAATALDELRSRRRKRATG